MKGPDSYIFRTVVRFTFFVVNALSLYLLLRGHNLPGGGFIAGLATSISLVLLTMAFGSQQALRTLRFDPVKLAAAGLLISTITGLAPMALRRPFLEHASLHFHNVPLLGELHLGSPLLFDIGVFLVVVGITVKIVVVLVNSIEHLRALLPSEQVRYSSPLETPIEDNPPEPPQDGGATTRNPHAT